MGKLIEAAFGISAEIKGRALSFGKKVVPVNYYTRHNNWGDQLNKYLIEKITKKTVVKNNFKSFKHILAIGSVLSSASRKSIIWGSGFISSDAGLRSSNLDIRAVRGNLTRERLINEFGIDCPDVLGDPAVLLPIFYDASHIKKKYKIGIIPHYNDKMSSTVIRLLDLGCVLVDIQDDIEPFIKKLNECEFILSSSLHGLIAADSYRIPNLRVIFGNKIVGGDYKFHDYYSTTNNALPNKLQLLEKDPIDLDDIISKCRISEFVMDKELLLNSFPKEYL
ncbi:TPA: polysaccharide pyruvyl transferase family protein [Vibrio cholerae]|nr:polysaccharide pyruvyl transferase family protein [Vibrio cholerae]